ncbi:MAG TPA: macrolide ABC transporter ATP-binding protein [Bacteroidales bacterium]|nr:MAG: macrolide ABC transporter ATP-binding protein [Bacteroidetes bacterium GWE2_42_24]OFY29538.1 MAG: macrolide ABC transporter ATP-binding protein [Bacteroidetes bacterium GWF2_43_11]HAQ64742.1 macrolide ABC transporter ATP-binding protein [Bacteroidales bacterium]HBZ67340.1 macrolide ABC transporter ATP-binding protein [Bacteroidales bacterium]
MIKLHNIQKVYRTSTIETVALEQINLEISKGEFVSVMGPSGCGKSTLLNITGLLDDPTEGSVIIAGEDGNGLSDKRKAAFRNRHIGFVFQNFHLINELNVLDNVELPMLYSKGITPTERRTRAMKVLERVGLSHRMKHFPTELSGGQSQRVAIARAVAGNPSIILADEPTGNLDSHNGEEVMQILFDLNREGTTIVMVTHDEKLARQTGRIMRFFDGRQVL